jgi:hypothetical protein
MKQQTINNIDKFLEPKKMISIGILCLIAILILWFVWKKVKDGSSNVITKIKDDIDLQQYMDENNQSLTYTNRDYDVFATKLWNAMYGAGTDEDAVNRVFDSMYNDADVIKLINAFGKRKGMLSFDEEDLYSWIANDGMADDVNEILSRKGISIRF